MATTYFRNTVKADAFEGPFNGTVPDSLIVTNDITAGGDATITGEVSSTAGFVGNLTGNSTGTHTGAVIVPVVAFAALGTLNATAGSLAFVSDADPAAMLVVYDGSNWIDVNTGIAVSDN